MKKNTLTPSGRRRAGALLAALGLLALATAARAETMLAGVARVDITPPPGFTLIGYPPSGRTATGTHDPLYARVLVLKVGSTRLGLVDLDLVGDFGTDLLATMREETRRDLSNLLVVAIHMHSGPNPSYNPNAQELAWEKASVEKIVGAIHEAADSADPVRIGIGYGYDYIGHNRLRDERDGSVTWYDKDWSEAPTGPLDPTVAVLRIDDMGGVPLAVLVNYACHPVIYGPDNRLYSADYPGVMTSVVEKAFDGKPMCFFLQGGAGTTNVYHAASTIQQGAEEFCRQAGTELGQVASAVAGRILTTAAVEPSLQVAEDTLSLGPRWDYEKWRAADPNNPAVAHHSKDAAFAATVTTILTNRQIALCALPGEPFADFQMQWRARCPVHDCLMLGYSGGLGYFPTIRQAAWGGYGASHSSTWVELGAGEKMVDQAIVRTYEMLGRLKDTAEDLAK